MTPNPHALKNEIIVDLDFLSVESLNLLAEFVAFLKLRRENEAKLAEIAHFRQNKSTFQAKLALIRHQLQHSGYQSRTKAEIDAQIEAEREGWGGDHAGLS